MGCGSSRQEARPHQSEPSRPVELQSMRSTPNRTESYLTGATRTEFLNAAFGATENGIIGGAALTEYRMARNTADVDVIVPSEISAVVGNQLLSRGMIRGRDGRCYSLDITADRDIGQRFGSSRDTHRVGSSRARIAKMEYLLNSKCYSYLTRIGDDRNAKMQTDAADILFIIAFIQKNGLTMQEKDSRWVKDYDFWSMFYRAYKGTEQALQSLGLRRDATASPSNRESRRSSMSRLSRESRDRRR